jgi:hypothetical protein
MNSVVRIFAAGSILAILLFSSLLSFGQTQQSNDQTDESRDIGFNYAAARTKAKSSAQSNQRYVRKSAPLKPASSGGQKAAASHSANQSRLSQIGMTTWILRPAQSSDEKRIIVQDAATSEAFTPIRVETGHKFKIGDRIRLSVELPREGYLYIVDREQFSDGTMGPAYLVFPTKGIRGGDNQVAAGMLTDLPSPSEPPLRLQPSAKNVVGELFTFIVSPKPLLIPPLSQNSALLPAEIFSSWLKWETQTETFELAGGSGKTWTFAEKEAAANHTRLKSDDPLPQTTFRLMAKPDQPMLVHLALHYGAGN